MRPVGVRHAVQARHRDGHSRFPVRVHPTRRPRVGQGIRRSIRRGAAPHRADQTNAILHEVDGFARRGGQVWSEPPYPVDRPSVRGHRPRKEQTLSSFVAKLAHVFTWWNGRTVNTAFFTWRRGEVVGTDQFGNTYYRTIGGKIDPALGFVRRRAGTAGSIIPPTLPPPTRTISPRSGSGRTAPT